MRYARLALVVVAALSSFGCHSSRRGNALQRPADVDESYLWAGGALPTGDPATSVLTLEKIIPACVSVGMSFEYTIRVRNVSSGPVPSVVVSDDLPMGHFEIYEAQPHGELHGDKLVWDLGTLGAGSSREILVAGRALCDESIPCCAHVSWGAPAAPPPPPVPVKPAPPPPPVLVAGLDLAKSTPAEACLYDDIPIRLTVRNPGKARAMDVKVVDTLPDGWTVDGRKTLTFDVGPLDAGASKEMTAKARASSAGKFTNRATATAAGGLTASAASDTVIRKATLQVTKAAMHPTVILGRPATFSITVTNTGDWAAGDTMLRDTMTGSDSIGACSDSGAASGATVTWNLGSLAPGASRTVTVSATRNSAGSIENTVTATAHCAEPVSASARVNVIGIPAILLEVKDAPDPIQVGGTSTYTIVVTNQGTAPDSEIVVICELESGVEYVSATGDTTHTAAGGKITFAALGLLAPKAATTYTVTVRGTKAADTRFKVSLQTKESGRPIEETEATRFFE